MRTQPNSHLLFCDYCTFNTFPVSKQSYLAYLAFLSKSLSSYRSLDNYVNILRHIMGDSVCVTLPVTVDTLLNVFQHFD